MTSTRRATRVAAVCEGRRRSRSLDIHMKKIIHLTYASPKYLLRISAIGRFGRYVLLTGSILMWTRNVYSFVTLLLQDSGASWRIEYSLLDLVSRLVWQRGDVLIRLRCTRLRLIVPQAFYPNIANLRTYVYLGAT